MSDDEHDCDFCHAAESRWIFCKWNLCQACIDAIMAKRSALAKIAEFAAKEKKDEGAE